MLIKIGYFNCLLSSFLQEEGKESEEVKEDETEEGKEETESEESATEDEEEETKAKDEL